MERRLSAILAADMVGYSRLIEADEQGTIERQKAHRSQLIDPTIAQHNGRIVKTTGDGLLVEFPSVVEAVNCAVEIQRAMIKREEDFGEHNRIQYRVGINLGDVVVEDDDLYGDGVNIAARLEQLAEPGGISISGHAYDTVRSSTDIGFQSLGDVQVKNIERPIRTYKVLIDPELAGRVADRRHNGVRKRKWSIITAVLSVVVVVIGGGAWWWSQQPVFEPVDPGTMVHELPDKPSIAVLPFANMSNDKSQEYFVDGMTDDLITRLANVSGLFVIARNSVFTFKSRNVKVQNVARELGVRYVLEGSVRRAGGKIRINAQLIDATTGGHLWAEIFDRDAGDIFVLQDEVTDKIVSALKVKLTDSEMQAIHPSYTDNVEAYDLYLKGRWEFSSVNKTGNLAARAFFEKAVELDPGFANAYALLAWSYQRGYSFGWDDDIHQSLATAEVLARKAVRLDDRNSGAFRVLGIIQLYQRRHAEAVRSAERAVMLNPNDADSHAMLAFILTYAGFPEKSEKLITDGMRLNPHHSYLYFLVLGQSRFMQGQYQKAADLFSKAASRNPADTQVKMWLGASKVLSGQIDEAQWAISELLTDNESYTIETVMSRIPFKDKWQAEKLSEGLRKAGLPD